MRTRILFSVVPLLIGGLYSGNLFAATPQNDPTFYVVTVSCAPNLGSSEQVRWVSNVIRADKPTTSTNVENQARSAWRSQNREIASQGTCPAPSMSSQRHQSRASAAEARESILSAGARTFSVDYVEN
jgi:hypothetical protein